MAVAQVTQNDNCGPLSCYKPRNAPCPVTFRIDSFTSQGLQPNGKIRYTATCSGSWSFPNGIVWASNAPFPNSMSIGGKST